MHHLPKAASLPSQNQTDINHEGHEVFYASFFMLFMPFMV